MNNFYIIAHRGVTENGFLENSKKSLTAIKSFNKMIKLGIEFDIQITSDNKIVIYHDNMMEDKEIEKTNYKVLKDLNSELIDIEEILKEFDNTDYLLNIELKNYSNSDDRLSIFVNILESIVSLYNVNYYYSSFDKNICKKLSGCYFISEDINSKNVRITEYKNINNFKNLLGAYTLFDSPDFNKSIIDVIISKGILYLITDNVEKLINYLYKD